MERGNEADDDDDDDHDDNDGWSFSLFKQRNFCRKFRRGSNRCDVHDKYSAIVI